MSIISCNAVRIIMRLPICALLILDKLAARRCVALQDSEKRVKNGVIDISEGRRKYWSGNFRVCRTCSYGPVLGESRLTSVLRYLLGDGLCSHWMSPSTTLSSVVRRNNLTLHF